MSSLEIDSYTQFVTSNLQDQLEDTSVEPTENTKQIECENYSFEGSEPFRSFDDEELSSEEDFNPFAIREKRADNFEQKTNESNVQPSETIKRLFSNNKSDILHHSSHDRDLAKNVQSFSRLNDAPDAKNQSDITNRAGTMPSAIQHSNKESDFVKLQNDLEERIKILEQREVALLEATTKRAQSTQYPEVNNWPPFPKWTHLTPCFYQNIVDDIPKAYRELVKKIYHIWLLHVLLLTCNVLVGLINLFVGLGNNEATNDGKEFGLAILYFFLFIPTSYTCWFRLVYKACKNDSSILFMSFFFTSFPQFIFSILFSLGIPNSGFFGLINGITQFTCEICTGKNFFVGICMIALGIAFACCGGFQCYVTIKINKLYTNKGPIGKKDTKSRNNNKA